MSERDDWRRQQFEEKLAAHLNTWTERLNLSHWEIGCDMDELDKALAQCEVNKRHGHKATVTFTESLLFLDDKTRETIIIHELLHIPLDDMAQFAERGMSDEDKEWFARLLETYTADLSKALYNLVRQEDGNSI